MKITKKTITKWGAINASNASTDAGRAFARFGFEAETDVSGSRFAKRAESLGEILVTNLEGCDCPAKLSDPVAVGVYGADGEVIRIDEYKALRDYLKKLADQEFRFRYFR